MIHLEIKGKLKDKTSIEELKNALHKVLNYEPSRMKVDDYNNLKGYIGIGSGDNYTENDILRILARHCTNFKVEVDDDGYYDKSFFSSYFIWDGKNLIQRVKDMFGTTDEVEDWNWIFE